MESANNVVVEARLKFPLSLRDEPFCRASGKKEGKQANIGWFLGEGKTQAHKETGSKDSHTAAPRVLPMEQTMPGTWEQEMCPRLPLWWEPGRRIERCIDPADL